MEEKTYTLNVRQVDKFRFEVTIPEIGASVEGSNIDGAMTYASRAIVKHLTTRYLILVFVDQHFDEEGWFIDPQERAQTDLEKQATFEVEQRGIAPLVERRERHLVFKLDAPLTREQARWLDENEGKLFYRYFTKDEIEVSLDEMKEEARKR
jgi:hypothetical protein